MTSAGSSEKLQPMDIREAPKAVPRVISKIPISSKPSAAAVAPTALSRWWGILRGKLSRARNPWFG